MVLLPKILPNILLLSVVSLRLSRETASIDQTTWKMRLLLFLHLKKKVIVFTYLFLAVLGLRCCSGFSPVLGSGGCSPAVVLGPLVAVGSSRCRTQALGRSSFSSRGVQAH